MEEKEQWWWLLNNLLQSMLDLYISIRIYHWRTLNTNLELHRILEEIKNFLEGNIDKLAEHIIMLKWIVDSKDYTADIGKEEPEDIKQDSIIQIDTLLDDISSKRKIENLVIQQYLIDVVEWLNLLNNKLRWVKI